MTRKGVCVLALVAILGMGGVSGLAGASSFADSEIFHHWSRAYEELGGDHQVMVFLRSSKRGLSTEVVQTKGSVELDLIDGVVRVELTGLDRRVDVWLLDNKPGAGKSLLPDSGDVLLHLATLNPGQSDVRVVERKLGPDFFRGVELNWILVSPQGVSPAESRLLYGSRTYMEMLYTRQRLARDGFIELQALAGAVEEVAPVEEAPSPIPLPPIAKKPHEILVEKGLVSKSVFKGGEVFFRETFEGNGRSCGTCHPAENNQTVEPAFMTTLPDSDPLFVAEQRPPYDPISNLERPPLMRNFGLILENVDGLEDPNVKFLMRSVPHSLSLATSILAPTPNTTPFEDRTGWSGDGAPPPGRLREFLLGAIIQHYPNNSLARVFKEDVPPGLPFDFRMPTESELDTTNEYMLAVGRTNELDLNAMSLNNPRADNGRVLYIPTGCNFCHFQAGANTPGGTNNNFNTNVELVPNPAQGFMGINFPLDGGFGGQGLASPNRDCDLDGVLDCFGDGAFNTPPLVEAADTGPFFHNDIAETIEDAVEFYNGPDSVFQVINFTTDQVNDMAAFLRVINAAFNIAIAVQRDEAIPVIEPSVSISAEAVQVINKGIRGTSNKLLLLSNVEIDDALAVLTDGPIGNLDPTATYLLNQAKSLNTQALNTTNTRQRNNLIKRAVSNMKSAAASLGTGLDYVLGSGNLLF